jgi:hypothetical protein
VRWRKRPVVIDAVPAREAIAAAANDWSALPVWLAEAYEKGGIIFGPDWILIDTLEGQHRAEVDDMIIRGVEGELYPCQPGIFAKTYEAVQ